jgi:pyruvate dehydrogenase E1 component alpha subunit
MADLSKDQLLEMYHLMVLIRRFEERSKELHQQGKIGGAYLHLYNGQEAVGVGAVRAIRPQDDVITAYRDHGIAIARGIDPKPLMAEMWGKRTGVSGGKGGSMHLASLDHHFWGGHGIVGAHLPLAAGIALKIKYNSEDGLVLCFFGDGASNNGYFHEALNLSAVWDLPVIWLLENNLYGMGTKVEFASGQPDLIKRAIAYGMKEGPRVDGMDVLKVYDAVCEAADYARSKGPILMEAMTYRYEGHGMSDKVFQTRTEELEKYMEQDPIKKLDKQLIERYPEIKGKLDDIHQQVEREVADAIKFAEESPAPDYQDLISNIYV